MARLRQSHFFRFTFCLIQGPNRPGILGQNSVVVAEIVKLPKVPTRGGARRPHVALWRAWREIETDLAGVR
jgi:hypothetical protein